MTRRKVAIAFWCAAVVAAWNVIFDFHVWTAATEFTREQVLLHQAGRAGATIHDGFSPRVRDAALSASLYTMPIVAAGAIAMYLSFRRVR